MEINLTDISKYFAQMPPSQNTVTRRLKQIGMDKIDYFLAVHNQNGLCLGCHKFPDSPKRVQTTSNTQSKMLRPIRYSNQIWMVCDVCFDSINNLMTCEPNQAEAFLSLVAAIRQAKDFEDLTK